MKNKQYLAYILADAHRWWKPGSKVFINAPTGAGKTTYQLTVLLKHALETGVEILYVSNRVTLHKQLLRSVCALFNLPYEYYEGENFAEFPGITLTTYQCLAEMLPNDEYHSNLPFYYFVVMDEAHFFEEDAEFNAKIQRLLKWRTRIQCAVEIYISATIEDILVEFGYWNLEWQLVYEDDIVEVRERVAHDVVRRLKGEPERCFYYHISGETPECQVFVYDNISDIVEIINEDKTEDKWVLFQSNKDNAKCNVAKNIKVSKAIVTADDKECNAMREIVDNQCFKEKVLITTKVLDNGISLHDRKIKHILIETTSKTEFLQMFGRRRIEPDEEIALNLYIPKLSAGYFQSMILCRILPMIKLTELSQEDLLRVMMNSDAEYKAVKSLYDARGGRLVLNPIGKRRLEEKLKYFEKLSKTLENDENYFIKEQLTWLGISDIKSIQYVSDIRYSKKLEELRKVLDGLKGIEMSKDQQESFRKVAKLSLLELLPDRFQQKKRLPGQLVINDCLNTLKLPYKVESKSGKKKGDTTTWTIIRI